MLQPWIKESNRLVAGFTGRGGGISSWPYQSLNCAFHVGDKPEDVIANRSKVAVSLGFTLDSWTCGEQVHGSHITVVTHEDIGRGRLNRETAIQDTDGLLTQVPGVLLTSFYADCVPLYFFDPVKQVVGLAHAGWKGTVAQIANRMVERMQSEFGCEVRSIHSAIGPSIGSCCYEVDDKVMTYIHDLEREFEGNKHKDLDLLSQGYISKDNGKTMLDLKEINRQIMIKAGILPTHIECTSWCTSCRNDIYFSYRKDGGTTGRMASWIGLKER